MRFFFFQAEDGIRDIGVTGVQTCALPISGGQSAGGLRGHEVAAQAVHAEMGTQSSYLVEGLFGEVREGEARASLLHTAGELPVGGGPFAREVFRVGLVVQASADYLDPLLHIQPTGDLNRDTEAVQELRPELSFLWVHRSDQDKA